MANIKRINDYYEDVTTHNKWYIDWLISEYEDMGVMKAVEKAASSLRGCTGCTNCSWCTNCTDCESCRDCIDCTGCTKCNHLKNCTDCSDCVYCIECTACICCGGCISCKYSSWYFLVQESAFPGPEPNMVRPHFVYNFDRDRLDIANTIIKEFYLPFQGGFTTAVMKIVESHAEKSASYRERIAYMKGYADGAQCKK